MPCVIREQNLALWQQGAAWVFVTWRLGEPLLKTKLDQWKEEREIWLSHPTEPWDEKTETEYNSLAVEGAMFSFMDWYRLWQ